MGEGGRIFWNEERRHGEGFKEISDLWNTPTVAPCYNRFWVALNPYGIMATMFWEKDSIFLEIFKDPGGSLSWHEGY